MGPRNEEAVLEQTLLEQTNYSTSNTTFNLPQRIFPRMKVREKREHYFHTSFSPSHPQTTTLLFIPLRWTLRLFILFLLLSIFLVHLATGASSKIANFVPWCSAKG
ncbi:hypothetical protein V8E51_008155 [Hyaloscypha variabilis]